MEVKGHINDTQYMNDLIRFIGREYGINAVSLTPAKRGYYGETWRLDDKNSRYFVKLDYSPEHQITYRNSLQVVEYLCDNGIDFIGRIIKTRENNLFCVFKLAVLCVFTWVDGDNMETDETKKLEYKMLGKIYPLTKQGFDIPSAVFSNDAANNFFFKWNQLQENPPSKESDAILAIFNQRQEILQYYAARLSFFADLCGNDKSSFYFTHGDAGGNLLVCSEDYHIVDWDEVMYAPPERDAWIMSCREWALELFNNTLKQNGIAYELRPDRLAFYCYHMYFWYLKELLDDFILCRETKVIEDYFNCWIMERMQYADTVLA